MTLRRYSNMPPVLACADACDSMKAAAITCKRPGHDALSEVHHRTDRVPSQQPRGGDGSGGGRQLAASICSVLDLFLEQQQQDDSDLDGQALNPAARQAAADLEAAARDGWRHVFHALL